MRQANFIPVNRRTSDAMEEYSHSYLCPSNCVLTGRCHVGDGLGKTQYEYAMLNAYDNDGVTLSGTIVIDDIQWDSWQLEREGYEASKDRVIVGRECRGQGSHTQSRYATARILFNGNVAVLSNAKQSSKVQESAGTWCKSDRGGIMTGFHRSTTDNGYSYCVFSEASFWHESTDPAPKKTIIVPDIRRQSVAMKESNNSFMCPIDTVLTGRLHEGDENGNTTYEYATLKAIDSNGNTIEGTITVKNIKESVVQNESKGLYYDAPLGKVLVGRTHKGDEQGKTTYYYGEVFFNGHPTVMVDFIGSEYIRESSGTWYKTDDRRVLTGRHHYGDENGTTFYNSAVISCDDYPASDEPVILHIKMHPEEPWFPMAPEDYIRLSRLRRHNKNASDDGYSKSKNGWVNGNSHDLEYYNIPFDTLAKFHLSGKDILMNLRPRDANSIGSNEVFLQPDDHLHGDHRPNRRVPIIKVKQYSTTIYYWLFFGYDQADFSSHQGDWELVIVNLDENKKIKDVSASAHDGMNNYKREDLEIKEGTKDELTIYCALGTHALFNHPGEHTHKVWKFTIVDYARDGGYDWIATDLVQSINGNVPWKYFAGAWGEVGEYTWSTGPLGPWIKDSGLGLEVQRLNNPTLKSLINDKQGLLIWCSPTHVLPIKESSTDKEFTTPENTILYWKNHSGDENGNTHYAYAALKAIGADGVDLDANKYKITIENRVWSKWHPQNTSKNFFIASDIGDADSDARVLTGRRHKGDENGNTRYQTGVVKVNGKKAKVIPYPQADLRIREGGGMIARPKDNLVIIGMTHEGDENGFSIFMQGYIVFDL